MGKPAYVTGLALANNVLYGVSENGGSADDGTIFSYNLTTSKFAIAHSFSGNSDGAGPAQTLISDSSGNLYGTTIQGGRIRNKPSGYGTIFKFVPATRTLMTIHTFSGCAGDGGNPNTGSLYLSGTTLTGSDVCGNGGLIGEVFTLGTDGSSFNNFVSVSEGPVGSFVANTMGPMFASSFGGQLYELFPPSPSFSSWTVSTIYTSSPSTKGFYPYGGVISYGGILYGASATGGTSSSDLGFLYSLDPATYQFTVLYNFTGDTNSGAPSAPIIVDGNGNLFGTSVEAPTFGSVWEYSTNTNTFKLLYSFSGGKDGGEPNSSLVLDSSGVLYGTTTCGGGKSSCSGGGGYGTIFKLVP